MDNVDMGESSCKKHSHNDNTSNSSRPLKKAKFPWQVKGKYHLKENDDAMDDDINREEDNPMDQTESDEKSEDDQSNDCIENKFENKVEENLEMLGDYLLKQDFSSLNTLLFGSEIEQRNSKKQTEINASSDQGASSTYPKYTPSYKRVPNSNNNIETNVPSSNLDLSRSSSDSTSDNLQISALMVKQRTSIIEDQYLKRWQARQIAKGYVDNTINRVLDSWFVTPLPPFVDDSRQLTLDVTGLLDDLAGNDGIENEGILMAISAHGLQNSQTNPRNISSTLRNRSFRNAEHSRNFGTMRNRSLSDSVLNDPSDLFRNCDSNENDTMCIDKDDASNEITLPNTESSDNGLHDMDNNSNIKNKSAIDSSSSAETPAWRHFTQSCNCSSTHRRANNFSVTNVPFHRRNRSDQIVHTATSECAEEHPSAPGTASKDSNNVTNPLVNEKTLNENADSDEHKSDIDMSAIEFSASNANNEPFEEHFDFIDAAVSYAIQAKGLIPF